MSMDIIAQAKIRKLEANVAEIGTAWPILGDIDPTNWAESQTTTVNPVSGEKTVTSTAAAVFAGASALSGRKMMILRNLDPVLRCRIGSSSITQRTGLILEPGATLEIAFNPATAIPIYAISEGASIQMAVIEL